MTETKWTDFEEGWIDAYHFTASTLRDGSPIPPVGETLVFNGPLVMCESGYHASRRPLDALQYAPGSLLHLVRCGGEVIDSTDKLVCSERTIIATIDAESLLRGFARECAQDVLHLWDAPDVVVQYLKTGDESVRDAAWDAARAARAAMAAWAAAEAAASAAMAAAGVEAVLAVAPAASRAASRAADADARAAEADARAARAAQNRRLVAMIAAERKRQT